MANEFRSHRPSERNECSQHASVAPAEVTESATVNAAAVILWMTRRWSSRPNRRSSVARGGRQLLGQMLRRPCAHRTNRPETQMQRAEMIATDASKPRSVSCGGVHDRPRKLRFTKCIRWRTGMMLVGNLRKPSVGRESGSPLSIEKCRKAVERETSRNTTNLMTQLGADNSKRAKSAHRVKVGLLG